MFYCEFFSLGVILHIPTIQCRVGTVIQSRIRQLLSMKFTLTFAAMFLAMVVLARSTRKAKADPSMSLANKIAALSKVDEVTEGLFINQLNK